MVIVMDMETGKIKNAKEMDVAEEFGAFEDEVLYAGWLPQPESRLALREPLAVSTTAPANTEAFLCQLYRSQE